MWNSALQDSVESVENLLKRHRDLEAKLDAQEGRLAAFSRNADELIKNRHSESPYIDGVGVKSKFFDYLGLEE